jgi:glycosyltransferase involved in cell wall biosynthesis
VNDLIADETMGARVPNGDVAGLAAAIVRYLADRDGRRAAGQRARAAVIDRYSLDRLVRDIATLYSDLLSDAEKAAPHH